MHFSSTDVIFIAFILITLGAAFWIIREILSMTINIYFYRYINYLMKKFPELKSKLVIVLISYSSSLSIRDRIKLLKKLKQLEKTDNGIDQMKIVDEIVNKTYLD